jgi:acetolactate synthase-1/2/3 large subunit
MPRRRTATIADLLARALADAGVRWAFTVPGESFLGLLDALPRAGVTVVATRHGGAAAFMAEAVGQLTGLPAACLGTRAVGAANLGIGIHTARQDSTPMVAVLGQVQRAIRGREALQEANLAATVGGLAKWAVELDDPERAGALVGEGLSVMLSGRPGPVFYSVPVDVFGERAGVQSVEVTPTQPSPPAPDVVARIVALLANAERPAILAGGGVLRAGAVDALQQFSERLGVPVFCAWRRPTAFANDHPHYLGMTGYGAAPTVLPRLKSADALLVIGCRLNEPASFEYQIPARLTRWAHVDLEPRQPGHRLRVPTVSLAADANAFLHAALQVKFGVKADLLKARAAAITAEREAYLAASAPDEQAPEGWRGTGVNPGAVIATLQRVLAPQTIITSDAGNFGLWLARSFRFGRQNAFLGPTSGAMGYGLPAAIAAGLAAPDRPVVALCGDGGFAMTMNELETAVRTGTRPVVLVFDNRRFGTIAMHQQSEGRDTVATQLGPFDFATVARAAGAQGGRVTRDVEFEPALRDALVAGRPAVLHLEVDPRWVSPGRFG